MTLNIPPVAHSSYAIPGSNLYRHESHFVVSSDQVNEHPDSSPVQRSALIHRQVYGSILSATCDILVFFFVFLLGGFLTRLFLHRRLVFVVSVFVFVLFFVFIFFVVNIFLVFVIIFFVFILS